MHAKDAILQSIMVADRFMNSYLEGLEDADLMLRPVPGMNHIAWQLGHLISSEYHFVEAVRPGSCPPLPEAFDRKHAKDATSVDDPAGFHTKAEYLAAWKAQREATRAVLETMTDEDLDAPGPERFQRIAPTVGHVFNLTGLHPLMHVGQFVGVRRAKQLPVAI